MAKKIKDTDYLAISARIRSMEASLLTAGRMEQMLNAHSDEEVEKILQECGYPKLKAADPAAMDKALYQIREDMLTDLEIGTPDLRYLDSFKLKYDYHNVKAILKAEAMHTDPTHMMMDMGRISVENLRFAMEHEELENLPGLLADAITEAKDVLDTTRDPQLSDIVLDRWMVHDMKKEAEATGSEFLSGYVQAQIDASNLRTLVRALRMGKGTDFLRNVLFDCGSVKIDRLLTVAENKGSGLVDLYTQSPLETAAEEGAVSLRGGTLTAFEKAYDDAVSHYLASAGMIPFGEAPLLGYLAAKETEFTNLRILLLGRAAGLPPDVIRSRLRIAYV